jgi:hypothetical protein
VVQLPEAPEIMAMSTRQTSNLSRELLSFTDIAAVVRTAIATARGMHAAAGSARKVEDATDSTPAAERPRLHDMFHDMSSCFMT